MKLDSLEVLRDRIGFDSITEIDTALSDALEQATPTLSSLIRTSFNEETVTEYFMCVSTQELGTSHQIKLKLKKGFVTEIGSIVYGRTKAEVDADSDRSLEDFMLLNAEQGTITVVGVELVNVLIRVTYTAGFETHVEFNDLYNPEQVPDWLREAAQIQALISFDTVHPQHRYEDKSAKKSVDNMKAQLNDLLVNHIRYEPGSLIAIS